MKPEKGLSYVCIHTYNQYTKGEVYNCNQNGYLEVNDLNYRVQDEVFFESYFVEKKNNGKVTIALDHDIHIYSGLKYEEIIEFQQYAKTFFDKLRNKQFENKHD